MSKPLFPGLVILLSGLLFLSAASNDLLITSITRSGSCTTLRWISHTGEFYMVYATEDLRPPIRWRIADAFVPSGGTNTTWQEGCCGEEFMMMSSLAPGGWNSLSEKEREETLALAQTRAAEGLKFLTEKMQEATNSTGGGMSSLSAPSPGGGGTNTNGGPVLITARFFRVAKVAAGFIDGWGHGAGEFPEGTNFVAVAAGWFDSGTHNLALKTDGTVVAWGANQYGQTNVPAGLTNVIAIAAGGRHSAAVRRDGSVTNWGDNRLGQITNAPPSLTNVVDVKAGLWHTLALRADGTVAAWGDLFIRTNPVPAGLSGVTAISAGPRHNLALCCDGTVVAWGFTHTNLLDNYLPTNVPTSLSNVIAISAGMEHNQALLADGTMVVWGKTNNSALQNLPTLTNILSMSAGWHYGVALSNYLTITTNYNTLLAWGQSGDHGGRDAVIALSAGALHTLIIRTNNESPIIIKQPRRIIEPPGTATNLSVLASSSLPLSYQWQRSNTVWLDITNATNAVLSFPNLQVTDDGHYRARVSTAAKAIESKSGRVETLQAPIISSQSPELEIPRPQDSQGVYLSVLVTNQGAYFLRYTWFKNGTPLPLTMSAFHLLTFDSTNVEGNYHVIVSNAAGTATSAVWQVNITLHGEARMWGDNTYGQRTGLSRGETNLVAISAGAFHVLGLRENGTVVAWGDNTGGQKNVPSSLTNVVAVAGGDLHSLALLENGTVRAWGQNASGQTNIPSGLTNVTAIAAGGAQSLALRRDGTLVAWGWTAVPSGVSNVAAISAGWVHALAVLSNGTVRVWQQPGYSYFTPPAGLTNVVATASGPFHALALKKNGTVVGWGLSAHGETNPPTGLSNVMRLSAGEEFSMALKNDGSVVSWGRNEAGQTNVPGGLGEVAAISAGAEFSVALAYNEALEYPVNVAEDLLLICNTNVESVFVKDYYLAHRPMVSQANVLEIGYAPQETISRPDYTNFIRTPVLNWLAENPTKRPKYWIVFLNVPTRIHPVTNVGVYSDSPFPLDNSVSYELHALPSARLPFITHINMGNTNHLAETNDCRAYIDKVAQFGSNYSPGKLKISASDGGYENSRYYFDGVGRFPDKAVSARNGVLAVGVHTNDVRAALVEPHIDRATNVAGYLTLGVHGWHGPYVGTYPYGNYAVDGSVVFTGSSSWYIMMTVESLNGWRYPEANSQGSFIHWFSETAFGGTNFSNTPVGAVTHTDEPNLSGINWPDTYFGMWAKGKCFGFCAWRSRNVTRFQAVGDPFVKR